jgi:FkbM family methyltransferase
MRDLDVRIRLGSTEVKTILRRDNLKEFINELTLINCKISMERRMDLRFEDHLVKFKFMDKYCTFQIIKESDIVSLHEIFVDQVYNEVDVKGKVVFDIGAYIGDSTIYFALKGANKVVSVEFHPYTYSILVRNLQLNNLLDKCIPLNAVLDVEEGKMKISFSIEPKPDARPQSSKDGIEIPKITLTQLIEVYGDHNLVLKMDCEGCEFPIFRKFLDYHQKNVLKSFDEIILEYHRNYGNPSIIINALRRAGFSRIKVMPKSYLAGLIHATR